jgi:hypothetical protein
MGFSKLITNASDHLKKVRKSTDRSQGLTKRFDRMRQRVPEGSKGFHKQQQLIDNMEIGTQTENKELMQFATNELKQYKDTWKHGNSAFPKNPTNPSKYSNQSKTEHTRTSRSGTGDLATDGNHWIDLPEGMAGTVVKKL